MITNSTHHLAGILAFLLLTPALLAIDNDHDGMDDLWQQRHNIAPFTGSENPDNDARINLVESRNMSDPNQANSHMGIVVIRDINPQDGLPDVWQAQFGITEAQKFDDPDGDQRTNIEEGLLLSNPLVADVPFTLLGNRPPEVERPGPDSFVARMADTAPGRRYRLEVSDTLLPDSWTTASLVGGGSPYQWGTGDEISAVAMTGTAPRKFFRWVIDDPDSDGDQIPDFLEAQIGSDPNLADSDGDGFADGEEYQQSANPLSEDDLPGAGAAWDERDGTDHLVGFRNAYKRVNNGWTKDVNPPPAPINYGASVTWSDYNSPEQLDDYGTYNAKWEEKWGTLSFPPSLDASVVGFSSNRVESLARQHLENVQGTRTTNRVELKHCYFTLGTSQDTKVMSWEVHRRLLAYDRVVSLPDYDHTYQVPRFEKFSISKGSARSAREVKLEPAQQADSIVESIWQELSVTMKSGEEMAYDSLSHAANGDARPWIMLPEGEDREINLSWNAASGSLGYQATGPVTPQTVVTQNTQTPSYSLAKFKGNSGGTGTLKVGVMKLPSDTPTFAEETFVNFAVYKKRRLSVVIHPIALAGTSYTPSYIPDEQVIEDYLNSVFKVQANIEVNVTLRTVISVAYDVGVGQTVGTRGAGNQALDILWGRQSRWQHYSAEETAIEAASNPVAGSINVYLVASAPTQAATYLLVHYWPTTASETDGQPGQLIRRVFEGWAGSGDNDDKNILWVKSRPSSHKPSILWTIAHEIGHEMGLLHCADESIETSVSTYGGTMRFTDNEARLMTGRAGAKRDLNPQRLIKWEWETIREYQFLTN